MNKLFRSKVINNDCIILYIWAYSSQKSSSGLEPFSHHHLVTRSNSQAEEGGASLAQSSQVSHLALTHRTLTDRMGSSHTPFIDYDCVSQESDGSTGFCCNYNRYPSMLYTSSY